MFSVVLISKVINDVIRKEVVRKEVEEKTRNKGVEEKVFNQYIEPQLRYSFYIEKVISFILSAQNETKRFS